MVGGLDRCEGMGHGLQAEVSVWALSLLLITRVVLQIVSLRGHKFPSVRAWTSPLFALRALPEAALSGVQAV